MANLRVSIIEKVKQADGKWTNVTVKIPKSKPGSKGLYLKDRRDGKFYLLWREGKRRVYHQVEGSLSEAIRAKGYVLAPARDRHLVGGIAAYCHQTLKMTSGEIPEARMQIVEAMHENGMALNHRLRLR
jgi:hypothetical protein